MSPLRILYKLHRHTIKHILCRSRRFCTKSPISNQILWRSIVHDSVATSPPISFSNVFQRTKDLRDNNSQQKDIEQSLVIAAESQRKQSPLRVARLITNLHNLPYDLSKTNSIQNLIDIYIEAYETLSDIKPLQSINDCDQFYKTHRYVLVRQMLAIPKLCHGILEKSTETNSLFSIENSGEHLTEFINKFASQRLATRVMSAHNMSLYDQILNDSNIKMGLFEEHCDVMKSISQAIIDSEQDCKRHFSQFNNIQIDNILENLKVNCSDKRKNQIGANFTYIRQHLNHMIFELLKNCMRAVIENRSEDTEIDIVIVDGDDGSITIKISDIGGGIARKDIDKIWLYGYTTGHDICTDTGKEINLTPEAKMIKHRELLADIINFAEKQWESDYDKGANVDINIMKDLSLLGAVKYTPMFGLGYGLPITKLYATFFGGNCKIQSIHGYGTDAYLYINNLSNCDNIIM
eukprot:306548_1